MTEKKYRMVLNVIRNLKEARETLEELDAISETHDYKYAIEQINILLSHDDGQCGFEGLIKRMDQEREFKWYYEKFFQKSPRGKIAPGLGNLELDVDNPLETRV